MSWPLVAHIIIGGLMAIILSPKHSIVAFLGGCVIWLAASPVAYEAGLTVIFIIGFFSGAFDAAGSA